MKKLLVLTLALLMALSSTAFAAVELEFNYWSSEQEAGITAVVDAFNASQDEIHVTATIVPWDQFWEKLSVGLPAGSAPDVFTINALNVVDYAKNGYLLDISDLFESGAVDLSKFPQSAIDTHTVDGTLWAVPKDYDNIAVFYNKSMFDAAGIEYPTNDWTWDEFIEIARQLTDVDSGIYGAALTPKGQQLVYDYIAGNGGEIFDEEGNCVVNSPENVETLTKLAEAFLAGDITPSVEALVEIDANTRFQSGMAAMTFDGSWYTAEYVECWGDDLGIVALPVMKEHKTTSHSLGWAASASTEHPEEVKTFLTYLGSQEAGELLSSVVIPAYEGTDTMWSDTYAAYGADVFTTAAAENWTVALPAASHNAAEVFDTFDNYMSEILSSGEVESNLAALQDEISALIAE